MSILTGLLASIIEWLLGQFESYIGKEYSIWKAEQDAAAKAQQMQINWPTPRHLGIKMQLRLRSITIPLVMAVLLSSCESLPPPPVGNTCVVDVANQGADCVPISVAVKKGQVNPTDANSFIPFSMMDNYICFSPRTWQNVETFIGQLRVLAQKKCQ